MDEIGVGSGALAQRRRECGRVIGYNAGRRAIGEGVGKVANLEAQSAFEMRRLSEQDALDPLPACGTAASYLCSLPALSTS